MNYRKKPVVIQATQWFKDGDHPAVIRKTAPDRYADEGVPWVPTLEGGHVVTPGDWIITGVKGEHYPCKPEIFEMTYEAADHIPQQPSVPEGWKQAVALAYGHLWHVNNEPMAPIPLRSSETAAYEARKQLRDLLTHEERGLAINQVQALLAAAPQPKE